ncbi:hypothetical protein U1Q18_004819 [Sarracenia purpurea var. burkii]
MPALKPYCFFYTSSSPWPDACSATAITPQGSEIYMPLAAAAISVVDSTSGLHWSTFGDVINYLGFFTPSGPINLGSTPEDTSVCNQRNPKISNIPRSKSNSPTLLRFNLNLLFL